MLRPGLVFAFLAAALWWALAVLVPPSPLFELLAVVLLPLGGLALWRWARRALINLFAPRELSPAMILTIAVATFAFGCAFFAIWRLVYLWLERPQSMTSLVNPWSSFTSYIFIVALVLYLIATRRDTDPPMPMLMWVVGLGAIAVLAIGFVIRVMGIGTLFLG